MTSVGNCSLCDGVCPDCGGPVGESAGGLMWVLCSACHATFAHEHLDFGVLSREDAEEVASWRYPGRHAMYDTPDDAQASSVESMLDAASGYTGIHQHGELIGFCSIGDDGKVPGWDYDESAVDIGAGMRPDLIGEGNGARFLGEVVRFATNETGPRLRATIAAWNTRALRSAESVGFTPVGSFDGPDGMTFTVLVRDGT